jgi:hypothetical protein
LDREGLFVGENRTKINAHRLTGFCPTYLRGVVQYTVKEGATHPSTSSGQASEVRRTFSCLKRIVNYTIICLTYSRAWVRLSEINSTKKMMIQTNWTHFYFAAPFYFGFLKSDAVGGA